MTLDIGGRRIHLFPELARTGLRLGRHLILDARSLAHMVEDELTAAPRIRVVEHEPAIGVLDQSDLHEQGIHEPGDPDSLGSCTGNAGTYALSALLAASDVGGVALDERYAINLYSEATREDQDLADTYPPTDSGSSGLGVCRALHHRGVVGGYRWARSLHGVATLLQTSGVMLGTPWFEAWFDPVEDGFIDAEPPERWGDVAGGHEVYVSALESWDPRRPERSVLRVRNSWGGGWGDAGSFRMRMSTYTALKHWIDVKQLAR